MSWATAKIGNIAEIKGGKRLPKSANFSSLQTEHPYIRARDIKDGKIEVIDPVFITDDVYQKISRYVVNTGDICITIAGNIGDIGIVNPSLDNANLTENAVKLINLKNYSSIFLKYSLMLETIQGQMKAFAAGAAQPKLGIYKVSEISIPNPPLEIQHKIASTLSAYDNLIENNLKRIKLLEEAAQLIYKEWFVNFKFPGYEHTKIVDGVPEGWNLKKISDAIELKYGKSLTAKNRISGEYPVYGSSGIVDSHNKALVQGPGIIVGRKGNVGSVYWSFEDFYPIDTVFYIEKGQVNYFIYFTLKAQSFVSSDVAVPGLNRNYAYNLPILIPNKLLLTDFEEYISPIFNQINTLKKSVQKLKEARDILLPRLMDGSLEV